MMAYREPELNNFHEYVGGTPVNVIYAGLQQLRASLEGASTGETESTTN